MALPRSDGKLVLSGRREGRALGIAVALKDDGPYLWEGFRDRLIIEIALAANQAKTSS